jgi:hypothetical protein
MSSCWLSSNALSVVAPCPIIVLWLDGARRRAKLKGWKCAIDRSDIIIPKVCPALGIPLLRTVGKQTDNTRSLGRVDKTRGCIKGNVRVVSWRANNLKKNATAQELIAVALYVARNTESAQVI